ncbi:MAG: hypothetical protein ABEI99_05000, partial [Halobaculum sp.]
MSALTRRLFLGVLLAVVVVSGTAFAVTYGGSLAWQQRDEVAVEVASIELSADATTVTVDLTVTNPLNEPIVVQSISLTVFPDGPPYGNDALVDPRTATVPRTTIDAQSETTVTVTGTVKEGKQSAAREAVAD